MNSLEALRIIHKIFSLSWDPFVTKHFQCHISSKKWWDSINQLPHSPFLAKLQLDDNDKEEEK